LLKAEFIIVDYQTIEDSVNRIRKNVNQLQSLIDEKIEVYSKKYSEAEIKNIVKKYQASNEKNVTQCVNDLDHLSNNEEGFQSNKEIENMEEYDWLNREKEKINYEFNQFFFETPKI
jgi:glutamyl-tRNA reductase